MAILTISALLTAKAQITAISSDMPVANDTLRFSNASTTGINAGSIATNTGANYT
ncbi:MAG: hypothetical protein IPP71_20120 [Bacteroidetes bacterium]|nr:hypothetical protein [Bacteroidota bacterium]